MPRSQLAMVRPVQVRKSRTLGRGSWPALAAWALYDWAGTPFTTLLLTFIFPVYFARWIVGDPTSGQTLWSAAVAISGVAIAVLSPVLGAIADAGGRTKPWLLASTALCVTACCLLWFAAPSRTYIAPAICLIALGNVGYSTCVMFSNGMLPGLAPKEQTGRWSGWAWALGYAGGLAALVLALLFLIQGNPLRLPLSRARAEHIRIIGPLVGLWFAMFAWPLFIFAPDRPRLDLKSGEVVRRGLATLNATLAGLVEQRDIAWFLLANMLYADALVAIFTVGGIYAAGTFRMSLAEVTSFGIVLNIAAGLGAFGFAWVDDWIGSRGTILLALAGLIASAIAAVLIRDRLMFWIAGTSLGVFVGPAQAASRSLMARLAPKGRENEFFGLFALSGRATAFLGPSLVAMATASSGSQRIGLASLVVLLAGGAVCLLHVPDPKDRPSAGPG